MKDITISARISEDLGQQLNTLAQAMRRSRSWIIEEALRTYVEQGTQFLEAVDEGIKDLDNGDMVDHSVVVDDVRRWRPRDQQ